MPESKPESNWFQDRKTAETNLNEIAGFKAAVLIGFRYSSREGRAPSRPFTRLRANPSPRAIGS